MFTIILLVLIVGALALVIGLRRLSLLIVLATLAVGIWVVCTLAKMQHDGAWASWSDQTYHDTRQN